jgi:hypothetical protein
VLWVRPTAPLVIFERSAAAGEPRSGTFARPNELYAQPAKVDELISFMRRSTSSVLQQQGCRALVMGVNRMTGRSMVTSVRETAADREASEAAVTGLRKEAGELAGGGPSVALREIAFVELKQAARIRTDPVSAALPARSRRSTTQAATSAREPRPSLSRMCWTCISAVRLAMNRWFAIPRLIRCDQLGDLCQPEIGDDDGRRRGRAGQRLCGSRLPGLPWTAESPSPPRPRGPTVLRVELPR